MEERVSMLGSMNAEQVREHMEKAAIFIATSDYHEGWGAVINEAMNSGCAVVASSAMGAVPFMIKNGYNGISFNNCDVDGLSKGVIKLLENKKLREEIAENAYTTIVNEWNADEAANRLIKLCGQLLDGEKHGSPYENGPCSKARIWKKGE